MRATGAERFSAADVSWQRDAQCNGATFNFVPHVETPQDLDHVRSAWCNTCPVRTECLAYALLYHLSGFWGGTDTVTRRKLGTRRNRVKCPDCGSKAVIQTDGHEVCQHCGVSWAGESRPRLPEEAAG